MTQAMYTHYSQTATSTWWNRFSASFENLDRAFLAAGAAATIVKIGQQMNHCQVRGSSNIESTIGSTRLALLALRTVTALEKAGTGKVVYFTNKKGQTKVQHPLNVAMNVIIVASRILFVAYWLHMMGGLNLGLHAPIVAKTVMVAVCTLVTINAWKSTAHLIETHQSEETNNQDAKREKQIKQSQETNNQDSKREKQIKQAYTKFALSWIDMVSLPFDFGIGMNGPRGLALFGASVNLIAGVSNLTCQIGGMEKEDNVWV